MNDGEKLKLMVESLALAPPMSGPEADDIETDLDAGALKTDLLNWLSQLRLPQPDATWENYVEDYSNPTGPQPEHIHSHKVLFAVHLYTNSNHYLILAKKSSAEDATGIGIITVSAKLREADQRIQKALRIAYGKSEQTPERLVNTVWIENFTQSDFTGVLDRCATAILGNELVAGRKAKLPISRDDEVSPITSASDKASDQLLLDLIKQLPEPARDEMITLLSMPARPIKAPKIE